jgi:hypothetical protein
MKKQLASLLLSPACLLPLIAYNITALPAQAQTAPLVEWQKSLWGTEYDYAYSIQQTSKGEWQEIQSPTTAMFQEIMEFMITGS